MHELLLNKNDFLHRAAELLKLSHVRLDREQISEIDNLDCLGPVTNLYLQKVRVFLL